jgi:isocitrate lyase
METKTADLADAKQFADAIHAVFPNQMMAYNLSPSFNWDTTGMDDDAMRAFPAEIGKLGFVFNFITYGGHQIDGLAAEEFSQSLREDGMLALARLQRRFRLLESPYRTPQTLVGGPRSDAALASLSGQTATTKAMGSGSTQHQHLVQTEVPPKVLTEWLAPWREHHGITDDLRVQLRPHTPGSQILELAIFNPGGDKLANIVFSEMEDRSGRTFLSVRDQNTFDIKLRRKRLMTLMHLFLIHRYKAEAIHYLTPTDDNRAAAEALTRRGLFSSNYDEVGDIIVADINALQVAELVKPDSPARQAIIDGV